MKTFFQSITAPLRGITSAFEVKADDAYLQKKFDEHRVLTGVVLILFSVAAVATSAFDWVVDPDAARRTVWIRLASPVWVGMAAFAIQRVKTYKQGARLLILVGILAEVQTLQVLETISGGVIWGIGLFLYFPSGQR